MRYIRFLFVAAVALALILVGLANREWVTLRLLPEELATVLQMPYSITLPLFMVMFVGVFLGFAIGYVWEYLREFKIRSDLSRREREVHRLERQVAALKEKTGDGKDDVLVLIE